MNTPPNSVRTMAPVGHASRQPAFSQCLQTSEEKSHRNALLRYPASAVPTAEAKSTARSTNLTCRHVEWPSPPVLSYELPLKLNPSAGTPFHSLHATSQALQPMHRVESVRKAVIMRVRGPALRVRVLPKNVRLASLRVQGASPGVQGEPRTPALWLP